MSRIGRGMDAWPPPPQMMESGGMNSGQISASDLLVPVLSGYYNPFQSGYSDPSPLLSGQISPYVVYCDHCKELIGPILASGRDGVNVWITSSGTPNLSLTYHIGCTGFDWGKYRGFETREHWIKESMGFALGTPCGIVADKCEEQGRWVDAEWLRSNRSGK